VTTPREARSQIVADLCQKFPDAPARTLAKQLAHDHPRLFKDTEAARLAVRAYFGVRGKHYRQLAIKRGSYREPRKAGQLPPLPASYAKPWEPFVIEARRVLVLSDLHYPYHDPIAIEAALAYGDTFKPDAVLVNGDLIDFERISRFDYDAHGPSTNESIGMVNMFWAHVRKRYPRAKRWWKFGNHDERMELYLMRDTPEATAKTRVAWRDEAGVTEHGVTVIADKRPVMLGKLRVLHGHEKGKGVFSPVNQARGAFLRLVSSVLEGHGHRTSEHTERTADGDIISCRSTGCLCGLWPDYARINKWDQSFATVEVGKDTNYVCRLHRIIDGKVY
jgi:predicted phosphodiesterase